MKRLSNSMHIFEMLLEKVRVCGESYIDQLRQKRDYEELSFYIAQVLMGGE